MEAADLLAPSSAPEEQAHAEAARFQELQARLAQTFRDVFFDDNAPRTVVIVPSLSLDQEVMARISGAHYYEERMLCLLMLLRLPRTRVIYLTSRPIPEPILDYYLHLLPGIPAQHARRRLTLLSCHDGTPVALTAKLLARPRLLKRILEAIPDPSTAHMTCFNVTELERTLALRLGLPIYGCDPALLHWGSKSGSRKVFREAGIALPEGFEDLRGAEAVAEALADLAQVVREERSALRGAPDGETPDQKARRERAAKALDSLAADIDTVLAADDDHVTWVESSGTQPSLRVAPVDVGAELAKVLWASATPVLTSATIPPGISPRLGLGKEAVELDVGSPFDYRTQSLLYVPRLPDVRHPKHETAAHQELEFLLTAAGGRTLALFTSWRAMRAARAVLDDRVPYKLLAQDDLPKPALIEAFRTDESSCLFATMGFWQGVDVPGEACSLVVIDRLPFARPDDPVAEARRERAGPAAFAVVDVPHAAIRLAQGAGRLVRTATDRGVVAVLDPRLAESSYRPAILGALPPMRRTRDREDVTRFFAPSEPRSGCT